MAKPPNHLHKYKRIDISESKDKEYLVLKCQHPTCSHYVPLHLAEGKLCECNRCGNPMILDKAAITLAKPHCKSCIKRKKTADVDTIAEFLQKTGV